MSININKRWNQNENSGHKSNYNIAANFNPPHPQPISKLNRRASYQFDWLCIEHVFTLIKYECNSIFFVCIVGTVFSIISLVGWVQHTHTISLIILDNLNIHIQHHSVLVIAFCVFCSFGEFCANFYWCFFMFKFFVCISFTKFKIIQNGIQRNSLLFVHFICIDCVSSSVFHPPCFILRVIYAAVCHVVSEFVRCQLPWRLNLIVEICSNNEMNK